METYEQEIQEHGFEVEVVQFTEEDARRIAESVSVFMEVN